MSCREGRSDASPKKGTTFGGACARAACGVISGSWWWNPSARHWYCRDCAVKINRCSPELCVLSIDGAEATDGLAELSALGQCIEEHVWPGHPRYDAMERVIEAAIEAVRGYDGNLKGLNDLRRALLSLDLECFTRPRD